MKRFGLLLNLMCIFLFWACKDDEPVLTFNGHTYTYNIGDDKTLVATLNGVRITEKDGEVVFYTPDNKIGSFTLNALIPGHDSVSIAGVELTTLPDNSGIAFKGEAIVSETEKIVFDGTIINTVLTINIDTVPLSQQS